MAEQKILIIGATSGIGHAMAVAYARAGWLVGATGRRQEQLEALQATAPDRILIRRQDVTAAESIAVLEELVYEMGGVDVLVYNSGIGIYNKKIDWEPERDTIAVNVSGFAEVATWAYRYFRQRGGGQFVGISSIASERGGGTAPSYHASKAFMSNFMEGLRQKAWHDKKKIFITDIRPGYVDTPMTKQNKGMFWIATSEKAARQIMSAIERKKRVAYITRRWALAAWVFRMAPRWIYERF
ncbi:MAG: SDR family NAD(P)-dependent oxidoreductase [Saprospiraceae bacterium]|nr:SDR family NAD(P)-dependent oxidoreductase [Saprospiraceae bacterium]